ncbi:hypothetical protein BVY03_00880 [bacterium K02(2017)]|nr:hypothetical protein BVY03_00880 [bacterium K02(2017)]
MFIIGDLIITLAHILHIVLNLYVWVIFAAVIISWIRPSPSNEIIRTILTIVLRLTEPTFRWVRSKMPRSLMSTGLDLTPMIVWLAVFAVDMFTYRILLRIGYQLSTGQTSNPSSFQNMDQFQY